MLLRMMAKTSRTSSNDDCASLAANICTKEDWVKAPHELHVMNFDR
jgi:hypothetical protein